MAKDSFIVLGVSREADVNKIKKVYRRIAKQYHPDISHSKVGAEKLIEVLEAYETHTDEARRKAYDAVLESQGSSLRISRVSEVIRKRTSIYDDLDAFSSLVDEFFEGFLPGFFTSQYHSVDPCRLTNMLSTSGAVSFMVQSADDPLNRSSFGR